MKWLSNFLNFFKRHDDGIIMFFLFTVTTMVFAMALLVCSLVISMIL